MIEQVVNEYWLESFKKFTLENADMRYWIIPDRNMKRDDVYLICSYEMYSKIRKSEKESLNESSN